MIIECIQYNNLLYLSATSDYASQSLWRIATVTIVSWLAAAKTPSLEIIRMFSIRFVIPNLCDTSIRTVQEIIKLMFDCRITPVMSGVKHPLLLKIKPVAHFVRIQQDYGCAILYDPS